MKRIAVMFLVLLAVMPVRADDNDVVVRAEDGTIITGYATIGAPICGYGLYHIGTECIAYGADNSDAMCSGDSVSGTSCLYAFTESAGAEPTRYPFSGGFGVTGAPFHIETSADIVCGGAGVSGAACLFAFTESSGAEPTRYPFSGGFGEVGSPFHVLTPAGVACGSAGVSGAACLYAFVESSGAVEDRFPFDSGFGDTGSPSDIFDTMKENDCIGTMDGYYVTNIEDSVFKPRTNYECATGYDTYVIANDCQYINMSSTDSDNVHSPLYPGNRLCAVLCDTGKMYTSLEQCATPCNVDGHQQRLYVGDGRYSVPLYMEKQTTPSMNFRFYNDTMCYMNLRPTSQGVSHTKVAVRYNDTTYYSSH